MIWNKRKFRFTGVLLVLSWAFLPFYAQVQLPFPIQQSWNSYNNNQQSFDLSDPTRMQQSIEYDPQSGRYVFKQTLGKDL